ncbi:MAG: M23 family metallopeptidase [Bacteroidota bacterium]
MSNFLLILITTFLIQGQIFIPIESGNRQDISKIHLTKIGQFGLIRKARPNVPQHYHTGIDIKRPTDNYESEPIFPIAKGIVISKRTDGPFANLIIEHEINGIKLWTLYEHISGVNVNVTDIVNSKTPIARFMNKAELDRFGWQFDHFHFELLKVKPSKIKPNNKNPERFFNSYSLNCYSINDLNKYYFDPMEYFNNNINK